MQKETHTAVASVTVGLGITHSRGRWDQQSISDVTMESAAACNAVRLARNYFLMGENVCNESNP